MEKQIKWLGRSQDDMRRFPPGAREDLGYQLYEVQQGETPVGSKAMPTVGKGCRELRAARDDSWFRVFYVASNGAYVWVLHCFQKKTNTTPQADIEIGKRRYREVERG